MASISQDYLKPASRRNLNPKRARLVCQLLIPREFGYVSTSLALQLVENRKRIMQCLFKKHQPSPLTHLGLGLEVGESKLSSDQPNFDGEVGENLKKALTTTQNLGENLTTVGSNLTRRRVW